MKFQIKATIYETQYRLIFFNPVARLFKYAAIRTDFPVSRQKFHMLNEYLSGRNFHGRNNFARIVFTIVNAGR